MNSNSNAKGGASGLFLNVTKSLTKSAKPMLTYPKGKSLRYSILQATWKSQLTKGMLLVCLVWRILLNNHKINTCKTAYSTRLYGYILSKKLIVKTTPYPATFFPYPYICPFFKPHAI